MRMAALALVSALALAACGQNASQQNADAGDDAGAFPSLENASYRAEATISGEDGRATPVVMIRDGLKLRMEFNASEGAMTIITDGNTNESVVITNAGGRTMAMRTDAPSEVSNPADAWGGELASTATRTGTCNVAGESGVEWTRTNDGTDTACVTSDGIILRATDDGRTVWETTGVQRGPQAASLFEVPPGVQVVDLGDMGAALNQMMEQGKGAGGN